MLRNDKTAKEKEVYALKRKLDSINTLKRNPEYIELEKPIHDGYIAYYKLRDDVLSRKDGQAYIEALQVCNANLWCDNKDFKYFEKKKWVKKNPTLRKINKAMYDALSPTAKKFFYETTIKDKYWRDGFRDIHYECSLSYELVRVVKKDYITHRKVLDPKLQSEYAEIEARLYSLTNGHPWGGYGSYSKYEFMLLNIKDRLMSKLYLRKNNIDD